MASLSLSAKDVNMGSWSREVVWADGLPLHEVAELREVDVKSLNVTCNNVTMVAASVIIVSYLCKIYHVNLVIIPSRAYSISS